MINPETGVPQPYGIGCATGSQNTPLRGGKGSYFQGGVRGTAWVHGAMLRQGVRSRELMHVVDWLPTIVYGAAGASRDSESKHLLPLDGRDQWPMLTQAGAGSARGDLLINIERENPSTSPCSISCNWNGKATLPPACKTAKPPLPTYCVIKANHKLILGGGGQPNTWYHDGLPYIGNESTPEGGCLTPCSLPNSSACVPVEPVQLYDVFVDEAERHNLAPTSPDLVAELMAVVTKYNDSTYVDALLNMVPFQTACPFKDQTNGVLTPCKVYPPLKTSDADAVRCTEPGWRELEVMETAPYSVINATNLPLSSSFFGIEGGHMISLNNSLYTVITEFVSAINNHAVSLL
jgi:hypothetical protein